MTTIKVDAQVISTCVAMPMTSAHIASKLRAHAQHTESLALNLEELTARVCVGLFPEAADPLAAIHPEREVDAFVDQETADSMVLLGDGLRLAQIYEEAEIIEFQIGEEELMQAIAVLRGVRHLPPPTAATFTLIDGGPLTAS